MTAPTAGLAPGLVGGAADAPTAGLGMAQAVCRKWRA